MSLRRGATLMLTAGSTRILLNPTLRSARLAHGMRLWFCASCKRAVPAPRAIALPTALRHLILDHPLPERMRPHPGARRREALV